MRIGALTMAALVAHAGCGKKHDNVYDKLLKQNEPALAKRLTMLQKVVADAKKRPALTPPKLAVRGTSETQFIGLEETTNLEEHGYQGQPGCHPVYWGDVYALRAGKGVRQGDGEFLDKQIQRDFTNALEPPYAAVCVQLSAEPPSTSGSDSFTGGSYTGECRFFDLESGAYLGGVPVSAQMSSAMVNTYNGRGLDEAMDEAVTDAVGDAIASTGVKPPSMTCSWPSK